MKKFESEFLEGLSLIANAVKSGLSLSQAFQIVAEEMNGTFSDEINKVLLDMKIGNSMEEALLSFSKRVRSENLKIFVNSIIILKETGGNLIETFEGLSTTIRERRKIEGRIKVLTTQGLTEGIIISLMPLILAIVMTFVSPDYLSPLFNTPVGWFMIFMALLMETAGFLMIKKIINIKV